MQGIQAWGIGCCCNHQRTSGSPFLQARSGVRRTLDIDDDMLRAAKELAQQERVNAIRDQEGL
jgi:hypothetical protein